MALRHRKNIEQIKSTLRARLREGVHRPGDRFPSTRALARTFGISYQTAHQLTQELCEEGWLERRATSGTYIPGGHTGLTGAALFFDARARRSQSFGARLLEGLTRRLERERIPWKVVWAEGDGGATGASFPVIWESDSVMRRCLQERRSALLLNDRPPPGLEATFLDSVSIDDFSGGASAAQLLLRARPAGRSGRGEFAVLSGPSQDARSNARRDGFLSVIARAAVVPAGSWFFEDGVRVAANAVEAGADGLFCANDRLAEAVIAYCRERGRDRPPLVGFDDAPMAESLDLTTVAIPWEEMVAGAAETVKRRLAGDTSTAGQLILTPRPVVRRL